MREAAVVVEIGLAGLDFYGFRETSDGLIEIALAVQTYPLVVVCVGVARVDLYGGGVVLDGAVELPDLVEGEAAVEEGLEMRRQDVQRLRVPGDRCEVVPRLARLVALGVVGLRLLLPLLLVMSGLVPS